MPTNLTVRPATPDDLVAVLHLLAQDTIPSAGEAPFTGRPTPRQVAALAEISADAHQDLLVGEVDDGDPSTTRLVATAQVTWMRLLTHDGLLVAQVEGVRTDTAERGRGYGAQLMAAIEDEARRRGAHRLQLTSNRSRTRAHAFYERLGFAASHVGMKKDL